MIPAVVMMERVSFLVDLGLLLILVGVWLVWRLFCWKKEKTNGGFWSGRSVVAIWLLEERKKKEGVLVVCCCRGGVGSWVSPKKNKKEKGLWVVDSPDSGGAPCGKIEGTIGDSRGYSMRMDRIY